VYKYVSKQNKAPLSPVSFSFFFILFCFYTFVFGIVFLNLGPPTLDEVEWGAGLYCSVDDTRLTSLPFHIEAL